MIKRPEIGSKALRMGRVSEVGRLYFITKNAGERVGGDWTPTEQLTQGRLLHPGVPQIILESLDWLQQQALIHLYAYCLMPDHLHLLYQLGEAADLSNVMQRFGSCIGRSICRHTGRARVWSDGFYDHALRSETVLTEVVGYIHENPVKAGFVSNAAEWAWSSAYGRTEQ